MSGLRTTTIATPLKQILGATRERFGKRTIILAPDVSRGGNLLYSWAWAHTLNQAHGDGTALVERNRHSALWLEEFPDLRPLTIDAAQIGWLDKRHTESLIYYNDPLTDINLRAFVRDCLLSSPNFAARIARIQETMGETPLVINVRRGDYYAQPELVTQYGIDIHTHVRESLVLLGYGGMRPPQAYIVSDDPEWCCSHLDDLADLQVLPAAPGPPMFNDLAAIAVASRVVLPNSTFSYWGQFISREISGKQCVVAPDGHERHPATGEIVMKPLDPGWARTTVKPGCRASPTA